MDNPTSTQKLWKNFDTLFSTYNGEQNTPPYKEFYKNDIFKYDKPLLMIRNCTASQKPANNAPVKDSFSVHLLEKILNETKDHYKIVYYRAKTNQCIDDAQSTIEINDFALIENNYPDVIDFNKLYDEYKDKYSFNTLQLMIGANCERFICPAAGCCMLAFMFGGKTVIYNTGGGWLDKYGCFKGPLQNISNCDIRVYKGENNFIEGIKTILHEDKV